MGSLFPHNVPLYSIVAYPQIDNPNTLMNVKTSTVEKTAMQYNDLLLENNEFQEDDELTIDEKRERRKLKVMQEISAKINADIENITGVKQSISSNNNSINNSNNIVDARQKITPEQWADAVRRAKKRAVQQTKETIPFAQKMRAMRRRMEVRKRPNSRHEMQLNRRRERE